MATVVPLLVLGGLALLGWFTRRRYEAVEAPRHLVKDCPQLPLLARRSTWARASAVGSSAYLHAAAGIAALSAMLAWGTRDVGMLGRHGTRLATAVALICIGLVIITALVCVIHQEVLERSITSSHTPERCSKDRTTTEASNGLRILPMALLASAFAVLGTALGLAATASPVNEAQPATPGHLLPGLGRANELVFVVQLALLIILALPASWGTLKRVRRNAGRQKTPLRWHAPLVLSVFAVGTAGSALAGAAIRVPDLLGRAVPGTSSTAPGSPMNAIVYPASFDRIAVGFAVAVAALGAWTGLALLLARFQTGASSSVAGTVFKQYQDETDSLWSEAQLRDGASKVAFEEAVANRVQRALWLAFSLLADGLLLAAIVVYCLHVVDAGAGAFGPLRSWGALTTAAAWLVLALPLAGVALMMSAWNSASQLRAIGNIWDVAGLWPRWYHPLAPPCYGERAIPELQVRIDYLVQQGGVVVSAHSQGTALALVALQGLVRTPEPVRAKRAQGYVTKPAQTSTCESERQLPGAALITYGCPLANLFRVGFPRYLSLSSYSKLSDELFQPPPPTAVVTEEDVRKDSPVALRLEPKGWMNFWRATDPIGGGPTFPGLAPRNSGDWKLRDPEHLYIKGNTVLSSPLGHSNYLIDSNLMDYTTSVADLIRWSNRRGQSTLAAHANAGQQRGSRPTVPPGTPRDVCITNEAPKPELDPTLGIRLGSSPTATAGRHRLVALGDSLTHGFQSLAIHKTSLSYPALIARQLNWLKEPGRPTADGYFRFPTYDEAGGLPLNLEECLRSLRGRLGGILSFFRVLRFAHGVARYWNSKKSLEWQSDGRMHNLAVYSYRVSDATTRKKENVQRQTGSVRPARNSFSLLSAIRNYATVSDDVDRAALRVFYDADKWMTLTDIVKAHGEDGGIETLVVMLGANNVLSSVIHLSYDSWATTQTPDEDLAAARIWSPTLFRQDWHGLIKKLEGVNADHVIVSSVPHVTIIPLCAGIGGRLHPTSRYYRYYTHVWLKEQFDVEFPDTFPYFTGDQARAIDSAIDQYNLAIKESVIAQRERGRDWYFFDLCGLFDRLAYRRYPHSGSDDECVATPSWWDEVGPFQMPPGLTIEGPRGSHVPDTRFLRTDGYDIVQGGLIALDGVHPTTIGYGIVADEILRIMRDSARIEDANAIDFERLKKEDTLIARPLKDLGADLTAIARINSLIDIASELDGDRPL